MFTCLKKSMVKQTTEEDPDEGIKDLVELALKKMACNLYNYISYLAQLFFKIVYRCMHFSYELCYSFCSQMFSDFIIECVTLTSSAM